MKKIFSIMLAAVAILSVYAQEQTTRTMRVFYDGSIIYQRNTLLVDSINFLVDDGEVGGGQTSNDTSQIYVGVVAFNQYVKKYSC